MTNRNKYGLNNLYRMRVEVVPGYALNKEQTKFYPPVARIMYRNRLKVRIAFPQFSHYRDKEMQINAVKAKVYQWLAEEAEE